MRKTGERMIRKQISKIGITVIVGLISAIGALVVAEYAKASEREHQ